MGEEPNYVNELPEGCAPDTPRCEYLFQYDYKGKWKGVQGRQCGLPADRVEDDEPRCCFHSTRPRESEEDLKGKLESAVRPSTYVAEAQLERADLPYLQLPGVVMPRAKLKGAILDDAGLSGAILQHADLRGTDFYRADLSAADLSHTKLQEARLEEAKLDGAILHDACLQYCDLRTAILGEHHDGKPTDLATAHLTRALISGARVVPTVNLYNVNWPEKYCLWDERCARSDADWNRTRERLRWLESRNRPTFAECANIYHELRVACQRISDPEAESAFFVREMECKRADMIRNRETRWRRTWYAFLYYVCGYGERPIWTAGWALAIVVIFAFLYAFAGLQAGNGPPALGPGADCPIWVGFCRWSTALYFSIATFTALGYADLSPRPGLSRALVSVEVVMGFVLLSLLMICIVRKFSR